MAVDPLIRVRAICLAYPETTERPSHAAPTFFAGKKSFLMYHDDHHGDGRLAVWCAAPPGAQSAYVHDNPRGYFVPAYVGTRGWVGVRLDRRVPWGEIEAVIDDAYREVALRRMLVALDDDRTPGATGTFGTSRGE
ncbi:MAG: hypothetical protein JWL73_1646 [Actinomycetia bacterium]|nr:hypothetical protein [Actinomycetes bacterium]